MKVKLFVLCLMVFSVPLWAAKTDTSRTKKMQLKYENRLVVLDQEIQALRQDDSLLVSVLGVGADKNWKFVFDGNEMTKVKGGDLTFGTKVKSKSHPYVLTLDAGEEAKLAQGMIRIAGYKEGEPGGESISQPVRLETLYSRSENEVNLYFDVLGLPYLRNFPTDIDDNDVINIYVVGTQDKIAKLSVDVTGNLSSSDEISIQGSSALGSLKEVAGKTQGTGSAEEQIVWPMGSYGPFAGPSIAIAIKQRENDAKLTTLRTYTIRINKTFLASFRFLVGKSPLRFNNYELKKFSGSDSLRVLNTSSSDGETRYFLAIVFYGCHVAKTRELNGGFQEGTAFNGSIESLPIKEKWSMSSFFGLSVDLRIATSVIGNAFGGSAK